MEIPRLSAGASADDVVSALGEAGCVVVENLASQDTMDALDADLAPAFAARSFGGDTFSGLKTKRVSGLLARSTAAQELALNPIALGAAEGLLGPHCQTIQFHVSHAIAIGPGEPAQAVHRDDGVWELPEPKPPVALHCIWALSDFTAENGGTRMAPGSHLWPAGREPEEDEIRSIEMPRGSVAFYNARTWHGGGANRSNATRTGVLLGYLLGWLRQEENQYLTVPPELARAMPEALQRLIGYDLGGAYLGWIDQGNPQAVLKDDPDTDYQVF